MFPSCSRSLRLSVNEQAHKKWHLWISSLTQTHTKRDSLSRSLCSSVQVQQRIWSSSIISASFSHFNQASFTVSITSLLKNIHSSSTANLNDSLRLSSCVFDLWKPDESKERERERERARATSSEIINLIKQSSCTVQYLFPNEWHEKRPVKLSVTLQPDCWLIERLEHKHEKSRRWRWKCNLNSPLRPRAPSATPSASVCLSHPRRSFFRKHCFLSPASPRVCHSSSCFKAAFVPAAFRSLQTRRCSTGVSMSVLCR